MFFPTHLTYATFLGIHFFLRKKGGPKILWGPNTWRILYAKLDSNYLQSTDSGKKFLSCLLNTCITIDTFTQTFHPKPFFSLSLSPPLYLFILEIARIYISTNFFSPPLHFTPFFSLQYSWYFGTEVLSNNLCQWPKFSEWHSINTSQCPQYSLSLSLTASPPKNYQFILNFQFQKWMPNFRFN